MFNRFRHMLCNSSMIETAIEMQNRPEMLRTVRWRKRRWAPVNAAKAYYVRTETPRDAEETKELRWRYNTYRTTMRSLKQFIQSDLEAVSLEEKDETHITQELEEQRELVALNDAWNTESAAFRSAREQDKVMRSREGRRESLQKLEEAKLKRQEMATAMLTKEQEEAKRFVDINNLEAEIENALDSRSNYNFAIDVQGNRFIEMPDGSTSQEPQLEPELEKVHS